MLLSLVYDKASVAVSITLIACAVFARDTSVSKICGKTLISRFLLFSCKLCKQEFALSRSSVSIKFNTHTSLFSNQFIGLHRYVSRIRQGYRLCYSCFFAFLSLGCIAALTRKTNRFFSEKFSFYSAKLNTGVNFVPRLHPCLPCDSFLTGGRFLFMFLIFKHRSAKVYFRSVTFLLFSPEN